MPWNAMFEEECNTMFTRLMDAYPARLTAMPWSPICEVDATINWEPMLEVAPCDLVQFLMCTRFAA